MPCVEPLQPEETVETSQALIPPLLLKLSSELLLYPGEISVKFLPWPRSEYDLLSLRKRVAALWHLPKGSPWTFLFLFRRHSEESR